MTLINVLHPCALALFRAHVSALEMAAPFYGRPGERANLEFRISKGDPTKIDLLLSSMENANKYNVASDVTVAQYVKAEIPRVSTGYVYSFGEAWEVRSLTSFIRVYHFVATKVGYVPVLCYLERFLNAALSLSWALQR